MLRAFSNPLEHLVTIGSSLLLPLPYHFKYLFKRRFFSEPWQLIGLGRYLMSHQEMGPTVSHVSDFAGIGAE